MEETKEQSVGAKKHQDDEKPAATAVEILPVHPDSIPSSIKPKKTKSVEKSSSEKTRLAVENSPTTATVFLAAPHGKNKLAFVGRCVGWENPSGQFDLISEIEPGYAIFKGTIPVPRQPYSPFKFVQINNNAKIEYEGNGPQDNRCVELLPDSTNFFIFNATKTWLQKTSDAVGALLGLGKKETQAKIVGHFLNIIFENALDSISKTGWDDALDCLEDGLGKISRLPCDNIINSSQQFLVDRLKVPELQDNFDHIFLMLVGAAKLPSIPAAMKEFLKSRSVPFSNYLVQNRFRKLKRNQDRIKQVSYGLVINVGAPYYWIAFRRDCLELLPRTAHPQQVVDAVIETMVAQPELLLSDEATANRVLNYMARIGNVDDIYARLGPVLEKNPDHRKMMDKILLLSLLDLVKNVSVFVTILQSEFIQQVNESYCKMESNHPDDQEKENDSLGSVLKDCLSALFNRCIISGVVHVARSTPSHLLVTVVPIVEECAAKKFAVFTTSTYLVFKALTLSIIFRAQRRPSIPS